MEVVYGFMVLALCVAFMAGSYFGARLGRKRDWRRHPACVAPHCLRGGKCNGPCKIDTPPREP